MSKKVIFVAVVVLALVAGGALALKANKDKDTGGATKTTQPAKVTKPADSDPDAVKKAVISYSNAYLGGHGNDAYNLLSSRCALQTPADKMIGLALLANQAYGNVQPTDITVSILSAGKATASYSYPTASTINQKDQSWLYEQGSWHYDGCPTS